jgi:hypothetical protein
MKLVVTCPLLLAVSALLVSCAGEAERDQARPTEHKSFSQRLNDSNGYKQDPSGNWVPKSDKRSSFESVGAQPRGKTEVRRICRARMPRTALPRERPARRGWMVSPAWRTPKRKRVAASIRHRRC